MLFGFSTDRTQTNRGICPCFLIRPLVAAFYNIIVSIPTDRTGVTGNTIGCTGNFTDHLCIPLMFVCLSTSLTGHRSIVIFLPVMTECWMVFILLVYGILTAAAGIMVDRRSCAGSRIGTNKVIIMSKRFHCYCFCISAVGTGKEFLSGILTGWLHAVFPLIPCMDMGGLAADTGLGVFIRRSSPVMP